MKRKIVMIAALMIIIGTACNKTSDLSVRTIEGTYTGSLTANNGLKSSVLDSSTNVDVTLIDTTLFQLHCFGGILDTTFMLNYYHENDSIWLCFTNNQFKGMFGYNYTGNQMMGSGMMGSNNNSNWMNSMNKENYHNNNNLGGFNMMDNTFDYTFSQMTGGSTRYLHFHGIKQ